MPSPLGHALGGFAAGWLLAGPDARRGTDAGCARRSWRPRLSPRALAFAALGMAADLDLLIGRHSQFTHSVGMTLLVGAAAYAAMRGARRAHSERVVGALAPTAGAPPASGAPLPVRRRDAPRAPILWLSVAAAAAYGSHVLLDWLAQDATLPLGITALWPFSSSYYLSGLDLFWGISRQPWRPGVVLHDVLAVSRELVVLGPVAAAAWWLRRRTARQILPCRAQNAGQPPPPDSRLPAEGESR